MANVDPNESGRRGRLWVATVAVLAAWGFGGPSVASEAQSEPGVAYNRDVRPILMDACISCHGPDSASRQADLRLDQREGAVERGAITPGDPSASEMIRRVLSTDESEVMPPPETKKKLTPEQIATLEKWVAQGAEYQPHWSFIPPTRPTPPTPSNEWWGKNAIDAFVAARLEAEGLAPATEADRTTLVRRVTLDLTGLPPTPDEVDAFLGDTRPDAYERLVDRLLASPRWGEHRGRYWLDVARYGDTHGIHIDNYREIWPYRDWVIAAFNKNMPFDEFTRKNLAGDLLPGATLDDKIGSGFNRCNITTSEGGAIDAEYIVLYARDRTETTSVAWMGLTAGCAVCHDHKFDPLSQKEFYELSAFFNNTTQAAMDGNVKDTPPVLVVHSPADDVRADELETLTRVAEEQQTATREATRAPYQAGTDGPTPEQVATCEPATPVFVAPLDEGVADVRVTVRGEARTTKLGKAGWTDGPFGRRAVSVDGGAAIEVADAGDFDGETPFSVSIWLKAPPYAEGGAAVARMGDTGWDLWWDQGRLAAHLINKWPSNALKVISTNRMPRDKWAHVVVTYDGSRKAAGLKLYFNGTPLEVIVEADTLTESAKSDAPLMVGSRKGASAVKGLQLADLRLYDRALSPAEVSAARRAVLTTALALTVDKRTAQENDAIIDWWLALKDPAYAKRAERLVAQRAEQEAIRLRSAVTHVMHEREGPAKAAVLNRGEYDQPLEEVTAATPAMLPPMAGDAPRNRLGLAEWLVRPEHPLTARVTVNRYWQELFGVGLVATTGDFGVTGDLPSHPELLDWLAVEFRESGWDVKRFFRLVVTSETYRQSAAATAEKVGRDPENRLLSRGPRRRLDAEMVRDQALASSGLLVEKLGGPSVKPYQPEGIWEAVTMPGSDTYKYERDRGEALYRRSMYTFWKRSAPPAMLETFNAPSRESCVVQRERTNTPMQALVTLNDPQFVEAARVLAEKAIEGAGPDPGERLEWISRRVLARPLLADESAPVLAMVTRLTKHYSEHPDDAEKLAAVGEAPRAAGAPAGDVAAWTLAASTVMNLDEALNK
ncbi:MAG: DUF1553 domain-containing protein [Lacipirellulaceae bacterium]